MINLLTGYDPEFSWLHLLGKCASRSVRGGNGGNSRGTIIIYDSLQGDRSANYPCTHRTSPVFARTNLQIIPVHRTSSVFGRTNLQIIPVHRTCTVSARKNLQIILVHRTNTVSARTNLHDNPH